MSKWLMAFTVVFLALMTVPADLSGVWTLSWEPDFGGNFDAYDCNEPETRDGKFVARRQ